MHLKSLLLKNYRQYKDACIDFSDGITGIVGLNGSGKSTLIEAVAWTLYGNNAARTSKEEIKRTGAPPSANVEAILTIEINGDEYKITRLLKGASQSGDASIICGAKVIAESVKGVEKEINHLLGMDWKSFYTSFFAKQKELNALTDLNPSARRDTIIRMLRIDAVDKILKKVKKDLEENRLTLDVLKKSSKDSNLLLSEKLGLEKQRKEVKEKLSSLQEEMQLLENKLNKFKDRFNEEREVYVKYTGLDKKRTGYEASINGLAKRESELADEAAEIKKLEKSFASIEVNYKKYLDLEKKLKKLSIARETEINSIDARLKDLREKYTQLNENKKKLKIGEPCPTCGQRIENKKVIEEHFDEELKKIAGEGNALKIRRAYLKEEKKTVIKDLNFDLQEYQELSRQLEELEADHEKYPLIKAKAEKKAQVELALAKITKEKDELQTALKKTLADLNAVPYDENKHEKITEEFDAVKSQLDRKFSSRNDLKLEDERLSTQIENKQNEIKEAEENTSDIKQTTLKQESLEHFTSLISDYRQYLISRIRPKLAEIAGQLLFDLTNGKYSGVELDEEYNLFIYDGNVKYPIQRFSGGEADIANLCLRLAISQLITDSSNIETGFIILDEIFGSQDLLRKQSIMEALNKLTRKFRQIILITHVDDLKDTMDNTIEVQESEAGVSTAKTL